MPIVVGNKSTFAIESDISHAFISSHFKALGCFLIHISNLCYGVHSPDATMMGASYDEVNTRIAKRGLHVASFANCSDAGKIVHDFRDAIYAADQESKRFFGMPQPEFCQLFRDNELVWAPDGDEAFDDGSYVLQFDLGDQVRLIGFRVSNSRSNYPDPNTLRDLSLRADEFYGILIRWRLEFEEHWKRLPHETEPKW